ncbi:MAG: hypothetical protein AB1898_17410 [Acidobacteriota bacterium]
MPSVFRILVVPGLLVLLAGSLRAEIIDRIVATVNQQIITLSDVEREMVFQEIGIAPATEASPAAADKAGTARITHYLIQQLLMRQQIEQFPGLDISSQDIVRQKDQIRQRFESDQKWGEFLKQGHINEPDVERRIEWQLQVLRFLDYRFRQFVVIEPKEVEAFYQERLSQELKQPTPDTKPPLSEVEPLIRDFLIEEKLDQQVEEWLKNLRETATIEVFN